MKLHKIAAIFAASTTLAAGIAAADCGIEKGSVRILSNDFEAMRIIGAAAAECASDTVTVTTNATTEHKNIQGPALTSKPAEYTVAGVASNSIVPLMDGGLIRPLDELVAKYGEEIQPNQLISIDGKVMAVAFMGNGQNLFVRKDILDQVGVGVPQTYDELLDAAEKIRTAGIMETPLAAAIKPGWDLAAEFVNLYLGTGADFFEGDSAELAIDNEQSRQVLATMRAMTEYMAPDYLTYDPVTMNQLWDAGQVAIMNQWASLAGAAINPETAPEEIVNGTLLTATPRIGDGKVPASALWWDGFTIATNISDEDAEASFQAMAHATSPEVIAKHQSVATWLVKGYTPGPAAVGIMENVQNGARPYPMLPYMGLLHTALSTELADFIAGREDADQALADVKAAYDAAARSAGFLK